MRYINLLTYLLTWLHLLDSADNTDRQLFIPSYRFMELSFKTSL